jgi:hypothetical protein
MSRDRAAALGLTPLATVIDACLVGCDPTLMLEGPIPASRKLLGDNGLSVDNIDIVEINEAFASVVLAWEREVKADMSRVNPKRWRDRARPPARCHRSHAHHQGGTRTRAARRRARPGHDVLWRGASAPGRCSAGAEWPPLTAASHGLTAMRVWV